ncbi:MAG: cupin domain-containing protein [Haliea sp.]
MTLLNRFHNVSANALIATVILAGLALPASGSWAGDMHHTALATDQIEFSPGPATLPKGAHIAVLHGHPAKEGPFVIRLRFPADYEVPPHRHSKEEHVTVISGAFGMGSGEMHDRSAAALLAPGGFVRIPVGMAHFAWTEEETVVQINGFGPFDVQYVNFTDDPRTN